MKPYIKIITKITGPIENNTYLIYDENKNCVIIDAPFGCFEAINPIIEKEKLNMPEHILITHTHFDHIGGLAELKQKYPDTKICVHKDDVFRLSMPSVNIQGMNIPIETIDADIILNGGETIKSGDMTFKVLHTPGHSPGCVCFSDEIQKIVFVGDTLFKTSIGRTDFDDGDYDTLINSIKTKLWNLDDNTNVYCGHGINTTIEFEKKNNPFLNISVD